MIDVLITGGHVVTPQEEGVLDVGVVPADAAVNRADLAALTNVAALVMNSPDAYTVR